MNIHFIAIGGAAMHNLALALQLKGYTISGSDDEINEPSASRLRNAGLFPLAIGWFPERISRKLDGVILGMHAREDNPELIKARELGIPVFSYPEYLFEQSKEKTRVVIGGSHGKTTITAMVLHVLNDCGLNFDFMVGSQIKGFDIMVRLSADAPFIILEGDEYLSSPIDKRPKFHLYKPHVALLSGIAWDHINVFPTFENYLEQFKIFVQTIEPGGSLIWCSRDEHLQQIVKSANPNLEFLPYGIPPHEIRSGKTWLKPGSLPQIPLEIFGDHNLMNLEGARLICNKLGVENESFYQAISSFSGAARRLETVLKVDHSVVFRDFAHSPSKLKATTEAVKSQFPDSKLVACMELHTFSSLNEHFLDEYAGSMKSSDEAIVYFNPGTVKHKKLKSISPDRILKAFGGKNLKIFTGTQEMVRYLETLTWEKTVLLMMSSGTFDGLNINELGKKLLHPTIA